jgi:hypothetical protein
MSVVVIAMLASEAEMSVVVIALLVVVGLAARLLYLIGNDSDEVDDSQPRDRKGRFTYMD